MAQGLASPDFIRSVPGVLTKIAASVGASFSDRVRQAAAHLGG